MLRRKSLIVTRPGIRNCRARRPLTVREPPDAAFEPLVGPEGARTWLARPVVAVCGVGNEEAAALPARVVAAVDVGAAAGGHGHDDDSIAGGDGCVGGVGGLGGGEGVG
jgi:hypothetical protein